MNSKGKGEISEAIVLALLIEQGFSVALPFGNNQRYDFILDEGERLVRVQVKTALLRQGCVRFNGASINGFTGKRTGYEGVADDFIVYCPDNRGIYRVPVSGCGTSEISLRVDENVIPRSTMKWAKDYQINACRSDGTVTVAVS